MVVLDAYAWIEYFFGSKSGYKVNKIIEKEKCYTLESNISEVYAWALREKEPFAPVLKIIKENSEIIPVTLKDWIRATELREKVREKKKGFGIIDSLLLVFQEKTKEKIVSGDSHFKGMKNVLFLD